MASRYPINIRCIPLGNIACWLIKKKTVSAQEIEAQFLQFLTHLLTTTRDNRYMHLFNENLTSFN